MENNNPLPALLGAVIREAWKQSSSSVHYWLWTFLSPIVNFFTTPVNENVPFSYKLHWLYNTLTGSLYWLFDKFTGPLFWLSSTFTGTLYHHPLFWFGTLFLFRYLRLVVHLISFWLYKPTPIPTNPTLTSKDCTVLCPSVDPENPEFTACIESCLINKPFEIIIITVGQDKLALCEKVAARYRHLDTRIRVLLCDEANKRKQLDLGFVEVTTKISVLLDDHVLWGNKFLTTALAPFEDPKVGAVGTNKRVRKSHRGISVLSYWNMIGALYLERHNFEIRATNAIDGGVFVISGRTSLHRTEILQDPEFLSRWTKEMFFFEKFGPLNPDDDNYITRFEVRRGWKIKIQYCDDACIETTLGAYPKFISQCLRWVRTTWRSNSASLFVDRTVWRRQPWCVYAVYITSFFNFALFNDAGLAYLLYSSGYGSPITFVTLGLWIFATKMVKLWAYFARYPEDLRMLPGYFLFAYFHSFLKLYAGLTFWNCHWGGRDLSAITAAAGGSGKGEEGAPLLSPRNVPLPRNTVPDDEDEVDIKWEKDTPPSPPAKPVKSRNGIVGPVHPLVEAVGRGWLAFLLITVLWGSVAVHWWLAFYSGAPYAYLTTGMTAVESPLEGVPADWVKSYGKVVERETGGFKGPENTYATSGEEMVYTATRV